MEWRISHGIGRCFLERDERYGAPGSGRSFLSMNTLDKLMKLFTNYLAAVLMARQAILSISNCQNDFRT